MTTPQLPLDSYDEELSINHLAECLYDGTLALIIGAGVSKNLGFPDWRELVIKCGELAKFETSSLIKETNEDKFGIFMDKIERKFNKTEYFKIVHKALYENVSDSDYEKNIIKKELLISIGALMIGSKRGSVNEVVTFNFDNVLEKYLEIHGYCSQIVYKLPYSRKNPDVKIFHINGYLPRDNFEENHSELLIFSKRSFSERLGKDVEPWKNIFRKILLTKVGLFVGLSGKDHIFDPILVDIYEKVNERGPTGFWLFSGKLPEDKEHYHSRNIVPLLFNDYDEIPYFLLRICQKASESMDNE